MSVRLASPQARRPTEAAGSGGSLPLAPAVARWRGRAARPAAGPEGSVGALQLPPRPRGVNARFPSFAPVLSQGHPLPATMRADLERRFGTSFADVVVHADGAPAAWAARQRLAAWTWRSHIVFAPATFAPDTARGRALLVHELAHVVQQRRAPATRPRGRRDRRAGERDARRAVRAVLRHRPVPSLAAADGEGPQFAEQAELAWLDSAVLGSVMSTVVGEVHWGFLREFLRGLLSEVLNQPAERKGRILARFMELGSPFGYWREKRDYVLGFLLGVVKGIWSSIKGLWEAVVFIVTLPYKVQQFFLRTLPELALRYGPRLVEALRSTQGTSGRLSRLFAQFLANPRDTLSQMRATVQSMLEAGQAYARSLGRGATQSVFRFLEEPWGKFGEDVGTVTGMVLFEVLLAVATDAIGNAIKAAARLAVRVGVEVVGAAASLIRRIRTLLTTAVEWLGRLVGRLRGAFRELIESLLADVRRLGDLMGEIGLERALAGGPRGALGAEARAGILESRAVRPTRTTPTTVGELMGRTEQAGARAARAESTATRAGPRAAEGGETLPEAPRPRAPEPTVEAPSAPGPLSGRFRLGRIPYGQGPLSSLAQRMRLRLGLRRGGNVAVFEFEDVPERFLRILRREGGNNFLVDGNRIAFQNVSGSAHSEQLAHELIQLGRRGGCKLNVRRIYSEYNPCTGRCLPLIRRNYPTVDVDYSFLWERWGRETPYRNAAVEALFGA